MSTLKEKLQIGIASRLVDTFSKAGFRSSRKPFYLDIPKISEMFSLSPTMLRRYLSGSALIPFNTCEEISRQLNIDALWLFTGNLNTDKKIDHELALLVFEKFYPLLNKKELTLKDYKDHINYAIDVYEHISAIENKDELEKHRLISWMLEQVLEKNIKVEPETTSASV